MITLPIESIDKRPAQIRSMLKPISKGDFPCRIFPLKNLRSIGIPTKGTPDEGYTSGRVPTGVTNCVFSYYEVWKRADDQNQLYTLTDMCFHIYAEFRHQNNEKLLLALHSEPACDPESDWFQFKIGPHLHVKLAPDPIGKIHIPMRYDPAIDGLHSIEKLDREFDDTVDFLRWEFFDRLIKERTDVCTLKSS